MPLATRLLSISAVNTSGNLAEPRKRQGIRCLGGTGHRRLSKGHYDPRVLLEAFLTFHCKSP